MKPPFREHATKKGHGIASLLSRDDTGTAPFLVALALLLLIGLSAVSLDGARIYSERRSAQNAADQSALTAAFTECDGGTPAQAVTAGIGSADENGFDNDGTTNTVQIVQVAQFQYRSTVDSTIDGMFSAVLGANELSTSATAVASCTPATLQGEALFANATSCPGPELSISGNNLTVTGGAHTNADVTISGEGHSIGSLTHVGTLTDSGSTNTYTASSSSAKSYPINFEIADYRPAGSVASAAGSQYHEVSTDTPTGTTWDVGSTTWRTGDNVSVTPGVYYSPGSIEVGNNVTVQPAAGGENDGITFVAEGPITFKDNSDFTAWGGASNQDLVVFSNHPGTESCTETAVRMQGNTNVFNGIVLAKFGMVDIRGNSSSTFGGVWGHRVEVEANSFAVSGPTIGTGGDPQVTFDE